ncbi:MAG TPA: polysaccharide lyase family 7 protein [Aeromicrobium sp.]|nr:polysaccharide lyase family 7 protein [Aeromicrobium sp.]
MTRGSRLLFVALAPPLIAAGLLASTSPASSAVAYSGYTDWKTISAGASRTCAIRTTGQLYCWGTDGTGSAIYAFSGGSDWTSVSVGDAHGCGIRGGKLYCWGDDGDGRLGNGAGGSTTVPVQITSATDWKTVSAGASHTCATRGKLYCWGAQRQPSNGTPAGTAYPAQLSSVGFLKAWKVTLPVDGSDADTYADEVKQPQLATYRSLSYFHTNANNSAVVLRAPVGGATTPGSVFARTELRNMEPYDGAQAASYNWTSGTHVLEINEAFTHVPSLIPKVVGVQIHDPDHEVLMIRLDGTRLYAQVRQLDGTYTEVTFTNSYTLGARYDAKVTADANGIFIDYNGVRKASFAGRVPSSTVYWYFKAGCYLHSKTSAGEAPSEYGEVLIYGLKTTHS